MYELIKQPVDQLRIIFRNTAQKTGLNEAFVEKDFWVCVMLDYLFHKCSFARSFTFKGGTSLSKCYGLIRRFSEDIDLILDWRELGYEQEEPWAERSNTKQDAFNKEANARAEKFLAENLLPLLKKDLSEMIGKEAILYILPEDPQTICFEYPKIYDDASVLQLIRLEIGALAAWTPATQKKVVSYVAELYPQVFSQPSTNVLTVAAERTFWEKATILHHEANRPEHLSMPSRYSRHYYDLYCIAHSETKQVAFEHLDLLKRVVDFKMKFYPRKWAHYELAMPGSLKLVPPEYRMDALRKDYVSMSNMMFGDYPDFNTLMDYIQELELEVGTPIYTSELAKKLAEKNDTDEKKAGAAVSVAIKQIMNQGKCPMLRMYQKGIYYRTAETPFGETGIDKEMLIKHKYLSPCIGYETGHAILNRWGLTTQMTNRRVIATNRVKKCQRYDAKLDVYVRPPKVEVNEKNMRYLQVLDSFEIFEDALLDCEDLYGTMAQILSRFGLDYRTLLVLAEKYYGKDVIGHILHTAAAV